MSPAQAPAGQPVLAVAGPTATGKTALAVALARLFDGEIVSADSMQIYRQMAIGTAAPTAAQQQGIPHHLIGFLPPDARYSVAAYTADAAAAIREIAGRGKLPILAGGTGLYLSSLLDNIRFAPEESDPAFREEMAQKAAREGNLAVWEALREIDPDSAGQLHPNNLGRVIRALEVFHISGVPMSQRQREARSVPSPYRRCILGLCWRDRETLYRQIDLRVEQMLEAGLLEEIRQLVGNGFSGTAGQAIGYKEFLPYLAGEIPLQQAVEAVQQSTRRYAKRQLTWFRRIPDVHWLYREDYEDLHTLTQAAAEIAQNVLAPLASEESGTGER